MSAFGLNEPALAVVKNALPGDWTLAREKLRGNSGLDGIGTNVRGVWKALASFWG